MASAVGGTSGSAAVQTVTQLGWLRALSVVDHQVDRHLALQAADVPMAKVVAQLVYLQREREKERSLVICGRLENQLDRSFIGEPGYRFPKDTFQREAAD